MKIDADLRQAITTTARAVKSCRHSDREKREASQRKAIAAFVGKSPKAAQIEKALAAMNAAIAAKRKAEAAAQAAARVLAGVGLQADTRRWGSAKLTLRINDEKLFLDCGGELPPSAATSWIADQVIAELVASPEKDRLKILKKYGIVWG